MSARPSIRIAQPTDIADDRHDAQVKPLLVRKVEARQLLGGMAERSFDRAVAAGQIPRPVRVVGRVPYWSVQALRRWSDGANR